MTPNEPSTAPVAPNPPATPPPMPASEEAEKTESPKADYVPIPIKPAFSVTVMVGARIKPEPLTEGFQHKIPLQNRTMLVKPYETTVDLLSRMSLATDGSMVLLIPGTALPFGMLEFPYDGLRNEATVFIVPNNPEQVGPEVAVTKELPPPPPPPFNPVVLHDATDKKRADVTANNAAQVAVFEADGYAQ